MPALTSIRNWIHRRQLRSAHKETLRRYTQQDFSPTRATISLGDALEQGVLEPTELHGYPLLRLAPTLDQRVWDAWNDHSHLRLAVYKEIYGTDIKGLKERFSSEFDKLLHYENLLSLASEEGSLACIQWVHQLDNPWRPIRWSPAQFIGSHPNVGNWAMDTFKHLKLSKDQGLLLAKHLLWDDQNLRRYDHDVKWLKNVPNSAFNLRGWPDKRVDQIEQRLYAVRVLDTLLPPKEWGWRRRWEVIGKSMEMVVEQSTKKAHRLSMECQGTMLAALLHDAPKDIQMLLCAFKGTRHPDEPNRGDPNAQLIRQHFYAAPAPTSTPSPVLSAVFAFVSGVDPDVEVDFVLEQMLRDGSTPVESYSLEGLDLNPSHDP